MQRTNYEQLAKDTAAAWRDTPNTDNDPVTSGQKRAADLQGQFAAFVEEELDRVEEQDSIAIPFEIVAAIVANVIFHMVYRTDDPHKSLHGFLEILSRYLHQMLHARDEGLTEAPGIKMGAAVKIEKSEVPN